MGSAKEAFHSLCREIQRINVEMQKILNKLDSERSQFKDKLELCEKELKEHPNDKDILKRHFICTLNYDYANTRYIRVDYFYRERILFMRQKILLLQFQMMGFSTAKKEKKSEKRERIYRNQSSKHERSIRILSAPPQRKGPSHMKITTTAKWFIFYFLLINNKYFGFIQEG